MSQLKIEMDYCFGIKHLSQEFDCNKSVHLIYAPNGSMKTSFAKTLRFVSEQSKIRPCDLLHIGNNEYNGVVSVKIDNDVINEEQLFVVDGDEDIDSSASFANFLASSDLKAKYDDIYNSLAVQKRALMNRLNAESKSSDCESELLATFKQNDRDTIYTILERLANEIQTSLPVFDFKYNDIFDTKNKIRDFVDQNRVDLQTYFDQFTQLMHNSTIFRSQNGHTFGTYQASQLEKSVNDGDFFAVDHKILLYGTPDPIETVDDLKTIIQGEYTRILSNLDLRNTFDKIRSKIDKNNEYRNLQKILDNHPDWIPELLDFDEFRKKVWKGHLAKPELKALLDSYNEVYSSRKDELNQVLTDASKEQERWKNIINLYKDRFIVPFSVEVENQRDIILKHNAAKLKFYYKENDLHSIQQDKNSLINNILSRGEKRAFHILQLLFEIESRKEQNYSSILVMDDIADSFDYQNKYAIIEYIKDLSEDPDKKFVILVLTHNFDFYRTVASRLQVNKPKRWMVQRDSQGNINFEHGQYVNNVFTKAFIGHDDNDKIFISMIPYVRNLIEYTKGERDGDFLKLTSCMHQKADTTSITEHEVIDIMSHYVQGKEMHRIPSDAKVYDIIIRTADIITQEANPNLVHIENKIVLSMAIRHLAEKYMYDKLIKAGKTDTDLVCDGVQTGKWTGIYKSLCPNDPNKNIIERVNMMTPELIHLNSFMYEPLIDLSLDHLLDLYNKCKSDLH